MSERTTIFVSYSRRDSRWLKRLQVHLKPYDQRGVLTLWDDTKIPPGDRWRSEIQGAIDRAAASVLLISADFLASDFVVDEELPLLLRRAEEKGGPKILSLFVGPVRLTKYPELANFQFLNAPEEPLNRLPRPRADEVLARVAEQLEQILTAHRRSKPTQLDAAEGSVDVFDHFRSAAIGLSILAALALPDNRASDYTLTELTQALDIRSRRLAHAIVERLTSAGWIEKRRLPGRTAYHISDEGIRQLRRLSMVADGPIRQAVSRC